ncbi:MAG: Tat pathway signal protein [Burkholderiales bacterium 66-5]|nr:MAG: Tat pathway signal protein [Burkholderiales bacterium 66-5]
MSRKPLLSTIAAACVLAVPALAHSRQVTLSTQLKNYGGNGAYLAVYLTDAKGAYAGTLWVAGGKAKYYKHLADWNRLSAGDAKRLSGVTGASVGAGRTLKVTADLADALIDAGYEIRIDAAAEDLRDSPSEVRVPLTSAQAGKPQTGKQYIQSFSFQLP